MHIIHHPEDKDVINQTTCQVVRNSFRILLVGTTIASSYDVKDVTPMHFADMSTTETTITTTKSTTKALTVGADDHDSEDVVVLESCTRERQKENEVGKHREEIRCLRAKIHGRHASVSSKSLRCAAAASVLLKSLRCASAAAAAALIPGRPRKPRVLSDIESYDSHTCVDMIISTFSVSVSVLVKLQF